MTKITKMLLPYFNDSWGGGGGGGGREVNLIYNWFLRGNVQ